MSKHISLFSVLILCIFSLFISVSAKDYNISTIDHGEPSLPISLTAEEQTWLQAHPTIRLAYPPGHEPTLMEDEEGKLIGVLADYFELINQRLETNISLTLVPWLEVDEKIRNKEIEGLVAATSSKVEALELLPTQRKLSSYVVVYGQGHADSLNFPDDLHGRRVAVLSGFNHTDYAVDQIRDKAEIIPVKSPREGLESVHQSRVDFFIGAISNNYLVSKYQLFGIGALHVFWDKPYRAGPAARSDLPELATILEKGVNLITDEELDTIVARWTKVRRAETPVELTPEERIWLNQHPSIELGYTDAFEPGIIINEDGSYRGTLVDILELLNQRLGTAFKPMAESIPELIRQVNDKELAGVLSVHSDRADKLGWLRTKSFMNSYPTIFIRKGFSFTGPSDLAGKSIALIDNVFFSQNLVDRYGVGSTLIKVKNGREGLEAVRNGNADLYLGSSRNSYLLNKYQFYDLIASFQFYNHPVPNVMGIRSDWPELVSILNKGFDSIAIGEIDSILRKWGSDSETQQALPLTIEEQAWLNENPRIGVGCTPIPPYMFSENGKTKGYLIDMMELLVNQVGLVPDYSIETMDENLSRVKSGELHTILGVLHNDERAAFIYFSENVMKVQMSIFAATSREDIHDTTSLTDKTIASYKGYGFEPSIKRFLPNAKIIQTGDVEGMLRLVASGEADAAVQELYSGEYILRDSFINGVSRKGGFFPPGLPLITGAEFAVSKKYPLLYSILTKAYDAIPESEKTRVWRKWFAGDNEAERAVWKQIRFTPVEQAWIAQKHTVRIRAIDWPPYMTIKENGPPEGISVDYLKLISERSGINFEYEVTNQPFADFLEGMKQHQGPDMTSLIVPDPEREQYLSFTTPYTSSPYVIFARDNDEIFFDLNYLDGKNVALTRGFIMQTFLESDFPDINLVLFDNSQQALLAVSTGKVDAYIGNLTVSTHILQKHGLSNLRVVGATPYGEQVLSMGNRRDWPELTSIMNKTLASITEEEKTAIQSKYIALRYEQGVERGEVIKWILLVVSASIVILLFFLIWNWQLRRKVHNRTHALEEEIGERKQAQEIVQQNQQRLKALASQLTIAEERERRRLAAELHDHVGQSLVFSRIQLANLKEQASDENIEESVEEVSQTLLGIIKNTKELVFDLSSPLLHEFGLAAATSQWLREEISTKYGLETECIDDADRTVEDNEIRALLFRNVRELVINVVKHAYASKVGVYISNDQENLIITVKDDGVGFGIDEVTEMSTHEGRFGLFSIQERIDDVGGSVTIESLKGEGCTVTMKIPVKK